MAGTIIWTSPPGVLILSGTHRVRTRTERKPQNQRRNFFPAEISPQLPQNSAPKPDENEVLGELTKLCDCEGTVNNQVNAKLVETSLIGEKTKEKHEKYNRPENWENLISTRVDTEIWSKVGSNTRSRDVRMQKLETNLLKSMIPIVKYADNVTSCWS